ncbi:MAG TPA: hypothetical protein VFX38_03070, partial [Gammaproteobacteria bacterium]|nr:hypothetical protein [Gammaproteobacteria bacterium]
RSWGECSMSVLQLSDEVAPRLWATVRRIAMEVRVQPPHNLLLGLGATFFVTRAPILTPHKKVYGYSLYLPAMALRLLSEEELAASLGHELAHLRPGMSPYVIQLAANGTNGVERETERFPMAVFGIPGINTIVVVMHFLSWFAKVGFPAFELKADGIGIRASTAASAIRSLVKQAILTSSYPRTPQATRRSNARPIELVEEKNVSLDYTQKLREMLANADPQRVRLWLQRYEEENPSPFHPTLAARAEALDVNLDTAISEVVENLKHHESSFLEEITPAEEELTGLQKTSHKKETVADIPANAIA